MASLVREVRLVLAASGAREAGEEAKDSRVPREIPASLDLQVKTFKISLIKVSGSRSSYQIPRSSFGLFGFFFLFWRTSSGCLFITLKMCPISCPVAKLAKAFMVISKRLSAWKLE